MVVLTPTYAHAFGYEHRRALSRLIPRNLNHNYFILLTITLHLRAPSYIHLV